MLSMTPCTLLLIRGSCVSAKLGGAIGGLLVKDDALARGLRLTQTQLCRLAPSFSSGSSSVPARTEYVLGQRRLVHLIRDSSNRRG